MQTTNSNDSMMSDFFQVGGHSNFGGQLRQMQERLIAQVKEKRRKEALEIKRLIEEEEKIEKEILNEQNVLKNQVVDTPTPQPQPKANKTPYVWIGLGAVVLVGVTILIVKKS